MLKNIKILLVAVLVLILCAGCSQKDAPYISNEYVLEYEGDKCYMSFVGESKPKEDDMLDCRSLGLNFDSLEQLRDTIINNKFTDRQLDIIRLDFIDKDSKKIQICNPNKLYQAVYPEKFEMWKLTWKGLSYTWSLNSGNTTGLHFSYITKDVFDSYYEQNISTFDKSEIVTKTENIEDRESTISYYSTTEGEFKRVCYKLEQGEKTLYIAESYRLKGYTEYIKDRVSLEVPYQIIILGEQNNEYFYAFLHGEEQRPSIEYLLEFGLKEL